MLKYLWVIVVAIFCINTPAQALVKQDVSKALSYRNVVSGSSVVTTSLKPSGLSSNVSEPDSNTEKQQEQIVDLQNGTAKSISIRPEGEFVVKVEEDKGYIWQISYDINAVIMTGNIAKENFREIRFVQQGNVNNEIYFDKVNSEGKVVKNKAVYVKVYQ